MLKRHFVHLKKWYQFEYKNRWYKRKGVRLKDEKVILYKGIWKDERYFKGILNGEKILIDDINKIFWSLGEQSQFFSSFKTHYW